MRRQEIVEGISQVVAALKETNIRKALESALERGRSTADKPIRQETLEAFKKYMFAAHQFTPAARRIAEMFKLDVLEDPSFWATLTIDANEPVHSVYSNIHFTVEYLPRLIELLQPEGRRLIQQGGPDEAAGPVLTLMLPEGEHEFSRPQRISEALMGVTYLYEAVATMESIPENSLLVLTCDSGSDKSFDLFGAAKVITGVKEIILSLWDRIVFYREEKVAHRLELVTASLPILEKLSQLQNDNAIEPEQAELLRRKIVDGVSQFVTSGATIPEMGGRSHVDPRQLMAPEPKLLTTGGGNSQSKADPSTSRKKRKPPQKKI